MENKTGTFQLINGRRIPSVGFGTWKAAGEEAFQSVKTALELGYRHIDTAAAYKNEKSIGEAVKDSGIPREELFLTSKVWNTQRGYEKTKAAFEKSLADLQLDYLDLYLIHWPASKNQLADWEEINLDTWKAMMDLYREGRVKAIGVSNFLVHHLQGLMTTEIPPMVNQIEFHPGQMQEETTAYCKKHQILVEAWGPLGRGKMLEEPTLKQIAQDHRKSVAQICIRWELQNHVLPLPKSTTPSRIRENLEVFDFELTEKEMQQINALSYFGGSGLHPDEIDF